MNNEPHTIIYEKATKRWVLDSGTIRNRELKEVQEVAKEYFDYKVKFENENFIRWRTHLETARRDGYRTRFEKAYRMYFHRTRVRKGPNSYFVRTTQTHYDHISQENLAKELDISTSTLWYRIRLGLIVKIKNQKDVRNR